MKYAPGGFEEQLRVSWPVSVCLEKQQSWTPLPAVTQSSSGQDLQGISGLSCCLGGMQQNVLLQGVFRGRCAA